MTVRKQFPPRDYETFASSNGSEVGQGTSETPSTTDSDKTSTTRYSAAQEAQRLAQGSWADNVFRTPATTATPAASTVGEEDMGRAQNVVQEDPSDPPPIYTPTDTAASTIPSSPTAVRSQPPSTSAPHHPHAPDKDLDDSPIPTWPVPKREYRQHETSQSIHGTFQLYDLLDLETTSGSIGITVEPKPGDKPAVMKLKTNSGSISIRMVDASWLPWAPVPKIATNRTLDLRLSTSSGSISGNVLAGNGGATELTTWSGSQSVSIYTVGVGNKSDTTRILTTSASGSQKLTIISSDDGDATAIEAKHVTTQSASLNIGYPESWMGKVHAFIDGSGHVGMSGTDLEKSGGGRNVYGWRGDGDLKEVVIHGMGSGSVKFTC